MNTFQTKLNGLSIGILKKLISDIPDECEIMVWDVGDTGFVDGCELEINKYYSLEPEVYINVKAESGYHD